MLLNPARAEGPQRRTVWPDRGAPPIGGAGAVLRGEVPRRFWPGRRAERGAGGRRPVLVAAGRAAFGVEPRPGAGTAGLTVRSCAAQGFCAAQRAFPRSGFQSSAGVFFSFRGGFLSLRADNFPVFITGRRLRPSAATTARCSSPRRDDTAQRPTRTDGPSRQRSDDDGRHAGRSVPGRRCPHRCHKLVPQKRKPGPFSSVLSPTWGEEAIVLARTRALEAVQPRALTISRPCPTLAKVTSVPFKARRLWPGTPSTKRSQPFFCLEARLVVVRHVWRT